MESSAVDTRLGDGPTREEPNACGSLIERDLASLAVFVAEELGHWDVGSEFEIDPATGDLRLSAAGEARCPGSCIRTRSILALQRPEATKEGREPGAFRQALLAAWNAQREVDAARPALEDFALFRIAREPGGCGVMYWYDTTLAGCAGDACTYQDTDALVYRLTFAGYPSNPYLHFQTATDLFGRQGALIGLDPTDGDNSSSVDGNCYRIRTNTGRYLDAYTSGDGDVVTREYQANDTQLWCFNHVQGEAANMFTIQHRDFSGQFLDAYTTSSYRAVLRDAQTDGTQYWSVAFGTSPSEPDYFVQWGYSPWCVLEALTTPADDYRAVTQLEYLGASDAQKFWLE